MPILLGTLLTTWAKNKIEGTDKEYRAELYQSKHHAIIPIAETNLREGIRDAQVIHMRDSIDAD